jgi:hypothetical protein
MQEQFLLLHFLIGMHTIQKECIKMHFVTTGIFPIGLKCFGMSKSVGNSDNSTKKATQTACGKSCGNCE